MLSELFFSWGPFRPSRSAMVACEGMVRRSWSLIDKDNHLLCALKDKDNHLFRALKDKDNHLFVDPDVEEHWRDVESHRLDLLKREKSVDPVWKLFLELFIFHIGSIK